MNKHIFMVMKWLNDKDSVSQEELAKNRAAARDACEAVAAAADATYEAYAATYEAVAAAYAAYIANAAHRVNEYFDRTGEDINEYLKELEK